jgi:DNA-binding MarR family transcriptional regulator
MTIPSAGLLGARLAGGSTAESAFTEDQARMWRTWWQLRTAMDAVLESNLQRVAAISGSDFEILAALAVAPDATLRARDLARAVDWERSRLSHHVRRMEARQFVTRSRTGEDGRGVTVSMTPTGSSTLEVAARSHRELVLSMVFEPLSPAQLSIVDDLFTMVLQSVERHATPGSRTSVHNQAGVDRDAASVAKAP